MSTHDEKASVLAEVAGGSSRHRSRMQSQQEVGMPAAAQWIMTHESSGNPFAGHLHASRTHSSAFGAFQMLEANRRHYLGRDYQTTDLAKQYRAASQYVHERYGSWERAQSFWRQHRWY